MAEKYARPVHGDGLFWFVHNYVVISGKEACLCASHKILLHLFARFRFALAVLDVSHYSRQNISRYSCTS